MWPPATEDGKGDYFGQTVNLSARIADYARQGEVVVSQAAADLLSSF